MAHAGVGGAPPPPAPTGSFRVTRNLAAEKLNRRLSVVSAGDSLARAGLTLRAGVHPDVLDKWDRAIVNYNGDSTGSTTGKLWHDFKNRYDIADLANLDLAGHISNIDEIWKELAEFVPYDTRRDAMLDPGPGNHPSSRSQPGIRAFAMMGIGFRCDTRDITSIEQHGFLPAYAMDAYTPSALAGTIMTDICRNPANRRAGFWRGNRDIINETAICVSRTLRGCGKFPDPSKDGPAFIYAIKIPADMVGFDTEHRQVQTGGRWLPGEKAFPSLNGNQVIAILPIQKNGCTGNASVWSEYRYTITRSAWQFRGATPVDQDYLNAELVALTGGRDQVQITVTRAEDFDVHN